MTTSARSAASLDRSLIAGLGFGIASSKATAVIVSSLPADRQGIASAVNDANREIGAAIGIAVVGSVYNNSTYGANLPLLHGLPAAAAEATQRSAAAGLAVAERLGADGASLADAVKTAFVDGLTAAMLVVSIVAAVFTVIAIFRAPKGRSAPRPQRTIRNLAPPEAKLSRRQGEPLAAPLLPPRSSGQGRSKCTPLRRRKFTACLDLVS